MCTVLDCFSIDHEHARTEAKRCSTRLMKLQTVHFPVTELLSVIGKELDKQFYGMEFIHTGTEDLSDETYIQS